MVTAEAKKAVDLKKHDKKMMVTVTERRKAEELIKSQFANLRQGLQNEVRAKCDALRTAWEKKNGAEKLRKQLKEAKKKVNDLENELEKVVGENASTSNYAYSNRMQSAEKKFDRVAAPLNRAEEKALETLNEQETKVLKQLWFGLLSDDALNIMDDIPTMSQLRNNGMSLLKLSATKLLAAPAKK